MFPIIEAATLGPGVKQFVIDARRIARKQRPGQFVIIRVNETGERIPLTIKASDAQRDTITLVVQAVGKTTSMLNALGAGDGSAIAVPSAQALRDAGNHVIAILGERTKLLILRDQVRAATDELFVMTDDGSCGEQGLVTDKLRSLIVRQHVDYVLAIGPIPMMRAVAETTRE
ncbi:MAG: ferredoxin/flavodoxin---NADP+ reductase [Acidobacteriota bacterium]|jgi:ferredoxin--NADP+ reductase|nr:ferredoxin/flavodoxin---NADP+ reductase [Acidobacteriota bacterium]